MALVRRKARREPLGAGRSADDHAARGADGGGNRLNRRGGAPENAYDGLLSRIGNPARRASLVIPFEPHPEIAGEQAARFDIVLGLG